MPSEPEDLRGLEPPAPMMRILEAIEAPGDGPHAFLLPREPWPLYPLLAAAGWRYVAKSDERGVILTVSRRY
jgi:hypothetical protein